MNRKRITAVTLSLTALIALGGQAVLAQTVSLSPASVSLLVGPVPGGRFDADEDFDRGVDLQNKGQFKEAAAMYSRAIQQRPKFTDAFFNRGLCYQNTGEFEKSLADFNVVTVNKPKMADGWLYRGITYSALKQYDKAIADYNKALEVRPGFVDVNTYLAEANFNKGDFDGAIKAYTTYLSTAKDADQTAYVNLGRARMEKYKLSKDPTLINQALADFDKYIAAPAKAGQDHVSGYLDRGDANMLLKAYDKAVADYTKYLAKSPKDTYALSQRGLAYLEQKKYTEAGADFDSILAIKPNDPAALQNKAVVNLRMGKSQEAILAFTKVISNPPKPEQKGVLAARAQAYMNIMDYPNAIKDFDVLIGFDKSNPDFYLSRGVAEFSTKAYDKSAADFQAHLSNGGKDPEAYNGLGLSYTNLKQYDKAAEAFSKYIAANPTNAQALYNRGVAYYNAKKYDLAVNDMEAVLKNAKPGDPLIAQANKLMGDAAVSLPPDIALKKLEIAAKNDPKNADVQLNYGVALQKVGKNDEAIVQFTKAINLNPKDSQAYMNRMVAYQAKKDWANVVKDTTAAVAIKPDLADALIARADANLQLKAYPAAVADYKAYLALKPKDAYALNNLGAAAFQNKDYPTAVQAFTDYISVATDPKDKSKATLSRGIVYLQMDRYDESIKDMTAYLGTSPSDAQALLTRGAAYAKKKDYEKAAADFEASYAAKPDYETATQGALAYSLYGDQFKDSDGDKAAGLYDKSAAMSDKAVTAGQAAAGKPGAPTPKALADTYFNKGLVYQKKSKAKDNDIEPLKSAVAAFQEYVKRGSALTPPPADLNDVKKLIDNLNAKIASGQ